MKQLVSLALRSIERGRSRPLCRGAGPRHSPHRASRRASIVGLTVVLLVTASPAWAQKPSPTFTKEFQAGVDAFRLGQYDEAVRHLEAASQAEPKLPGPHRFRAAVAAAQSQWDVCIASARTAIQLNPQSSEIVATRKVHDGCRESAGRPLFAGVYATGGAIAVAANVAGATVTVEGLKYGATPLAPRAIALGDVTVTASKSGWKTATGTTTILPHIVTDIELTLVEDAGAIGAGNGDRPLDDLGWLRVKTVAGATVRIDGKPWAVDDRGRFVLKPGPHDVEVSAPGRVTEERAVRVSAGQEVTASFELESRAARASRQRRGRVGVAAAVGFGAIGAMTAVMSSRAVDEARDAWVIETTRPTAIPLSESVAIQPLRRRAEIDALVARSDRWALVSNVSYGVAAVSLGLGVYLLSRAPEEKPRRAMVTPVVGDSWGVAVTGVLP